MEHSLLDEMCSWMKWSRSRRVLLDSWMKWSRSRRVLLEHSLLDEMEQTILDGALTLG